MSRTFFVTGTGTDVGKTVLTCWLIRRLRAWGRSVAGFKPLSSGGRADAIAIQLALGETVPLDVINPYWFAEPITPLIAARKQGIVVELASICAHLANHQTGTEFAVIEGAGGLLSPLGEDFDARDLLVALDAKPLVTAVNRLGVLNELYLTWEALPLTSQARAQIVLFDPVTEDASAASNPIHLSERLGSSRIHRLPRGPMASHPAPSRSVSAALDALLGLTL